MSSNHIKNIAIVGAGGQAGTFITKSLIEIGRFNITAITRPDSSSSMPSGINKITKVDYEDKNSLVSAMTGQDCLIITMSVMAGPEASKKLIEAAAEANVPWILPNEWGSDHLDPVVAKESLVGETILVNRQLITDLGKSSYIAFANSFWYEYSLAAGPWAYGFNFDEKKVTFFDKGETRIDTTTLEQMARGVAALLSLPIHHQDPSSNNTVLNDFKNSVCYVSSFTITQRRMFDSLLKIFGDKESDWTIEYEDSRERYAQGMKELQQGQRSGFGKCLYTRFFYPDEPANYEGQGKNHNKVLWLPEEDFEERTKFAVDIWREKGHMGM